MIEVGRFYARFSIHNSLSITTAIFFNLQRDNAISQDDINDIIDDPRYMAIVNSSGWPTTKCITTISKTEVLQQLVLNEVI